MVKIAVEDEAFGGQNRSELLRYLLAIEDAIVLDGICLPSPEISRSSLISILLNRIALKMTCLCIHELSKNVPVTVEVVVAPKLLGLWSSDRKYHGSSKANCAASQDLEIQSNTIRRRKSNFEAGCSLDSTKSV